MGTYRHMRTGRVITESEYRRMSSYDQKDYSYQGGSSSTSDSSGDFLMSAAIGAATDNALLGGILGGDMAGGIVGDLMSGGGLFD
jgi:hypothetical protein